MNREDVIVAIGLWIESIIDDLGDLAIVQNNDVKLFLLNRIQLYSNLISGAVDAFKEDMTNG